METIKAFLELKFKSYQLAILFIISISVPGILTLFYFYRELFDSYDLNRLIMLIFAISSALLISGYFICSTMLSIALIRNENKDIISDDDSYQELSFTTSSLYSIILFLLLFVIFYLFEIKNVRLFILILISVEIVYGIIYLLAVNKLFDDIVIEYKEEEAEYLKGEEDNSEKIKQKRKELYKLKRELAITEADLIEKKEFQFLRTHQERRNAILKLEDRIFGLKEKIKSVEAEIDELE